MKLLTNLFAADDGMWTDLSTVLYDLIQSLWVPITVVLGALGVVFAVIIAWSFWTAGGDETKVQKAKANIKWYVIGWFLLAIVAFGTPMVIKILSSWLSQQGVGF